MNPAPTQDRSEQMEIDASARWPVLLSVGAAVKWLVAGGLLSLASSIQLHNPSFLAGCEWFTYGRLEAAARNALVFGWGMNAALGIGLWLMSRLSLAALRHGGWIYVAHSFWNIGVLLGVLGILGGYSTSFELLEMPRFVAFLLLAAYALIAVWAVTTFSVRNTDNTYASQWWLFTAAFCFPWLYSVAQVMLIQAPVRGALQAVVNAWFVDGLYLLWFTPVALAILYYFLPKLLGRPIKNYYLASIAFWWWLFSAAFTSGARLVDAPVPVWIPTVGIAALMSLPVAVVILAMNFHGTLAGAYGRAFGSGTLRWLLPSFACLLLASGAALWFATRGLAATAHLTMLGQFRDTLWFHGVFGLAAFGALYFIVPRLAGRPWPSAALAQAHFGATLAGLALLLVALGVGGSTQGKMLNNEAVAFTEITQALLPWFTARSVAFMVLLVGQLAFAVNFFLLLRKAYCPIGGDSQPATFNPPPALALPAAPAEARH